jgi:hypothetical protein
MVNIIQIISGQIDFLLHQEKYYSLNRLSHCAFTPLWLFLEYVPIIYQPSTQYS